MRIPRPTAALLALTSGGLLSGALALPVVGTVAAAEDPFAGLNLEAHGFVSFGYLKSWGNNWLGETLDGTDEFWEAAANVIARPMDHLRLGAQLFVRDLGVYGNGKVELDWAYADWRQSDLLGVQVGRVKTPFGLYGDILDAEPARTTVFLSHAVYQNRAREIAVATDGVKAYGSSDQLDWALYAGQRQLETDGDFASQFAYLLQLSQVTAIDIGAQAGGMVHWRTPVPGLESRVSFNWFQDLELAGISATAPVAVGLEVPTFYGGAFSLLYEHGDVTWVAEYLRRYADRHVTFTPLAGGPSTRRDSPLRSDGAYLSSTWHARRWLDLYGALEGVWSDPTDRHGDSYLQSVVVAVNVMPSAHWSLKAEFHYNHGTEDVDVLLNPGGIAVDWQVLALKTSVDF